MIKTIDLSGQWKVKLDEELEGIDQAFFKEEFKESIYLPGSTSFWKKGKENLEKHIEHLSEAYKFEGYAWFYRDIALKEEDQDNLIFLNLERTRISYVWLDDQFVGSRDSFCTTHSYNLTPYVKKDSHRITIMISNVGYKTPGGHMTSPDTQTNWNGILGNISLNIYKETMIQDVQAFLCFKKRSIDLEVEFIHQSKPEEAQLTVICRKKNSSNQKNDHLLEKRKTILLKQGFNSQNLHFRIDDEKEIEPWNEYTPNLYQISVFVETQTSSDQYCITAGFRDLITDHRQFYLNDLPIMLRGKHDGMIFPLTGYAPMKKEEWKNVFQIACEYGINHYRFHTCCPPEAAFAAADEIGIYLEPELPFWGTVNSETDPDYKKESQEFLVEEGKRILKQFGNHPSFLLFSLGNELWGDKNTINQLLATYKEIDKRHWYTQGSNNFQFAPVILENDDFFCGVRFSQDRLIRGSYAMCDAPQGHVQLLEPENEYSYDEHIMPSGINQGSINKKEIQIQYKTEVRTVKAEETEELIPDIPVVSHEVGQYTMYPNFSEMKKYTGVLKPENLKIVQKKLFDRNLDGKKDDFFKASGKFAVQCYKRELEAAFRSKELAGFQILDLQDFTGQGMAYVGILDAFLDNKGLISAKEWRQFCSDHVLMLSFSKYIYQAGEAFTYQIWFSYMNPIPLHDVHLLVSCKNRESKEAIIEHRTYDCLKLARLIDIGSGKWNIPDCMTPQIWDISVCMEGTEIQNTYQIYVYPKINKIEANDTTVTGNLFEAIHFLEEGKKVLLLNADLPEEKSIEGTYCTDFWCYPMFASISEGMGKKKPIGTMGLAIENEHPALAYFPSSAYTTPQWWKPLQGSRMAVLDDLAIDPLVWAIDNIDRNHKLGFIYEVTVGNGKLLVCHSNLLEGESPEEKWLLHSLIAYTDSEQFHPKQQISTEQLKDLFS